MAASISLKRSKVGSAFFKATTGYLKEGARDYINEVMPITTSIYDDAKSDAAKAASAFKATTTTINQKVRQLKNQGGLKAILNWYTNTSDEYGGTDYGDSLSFDVGDSDISSSNLEVQLSEADRNTNKLSKAIVDSNKHLLEGQMNISSNVTSAIDHQTSVISAGFDRLEKSINALLEVVTKNTSTMIEATVAGNVAKEDARKSLLNGFNVNDYKKMVMKNFQNSEAGFIASMAGAYLPLITSGTFGPKDLVSLGMKAGTSKLFPNMEKNLKTLDQTISNTITDSLIKLGDSNSPIGKLFGIDSSRKNMRGERSTLGLKTVPFDSIAHESITNAIPGYLRKILVQLGGGDYVYDYRSRTFRTQGSIHRDFHRASSSQGNLNRASDKLRGAIGNDRYGNTIYDIMMADLGSNYNASNITNSFSSASVFENYMLGILKDNGYNPSKKDRDRIRLMGRQIAHGNHGKEIRRNASRSNVNRNSSLSAYISEADQYNVDLSGLSTSLATDIRTIMEDGGMISSSASKRSGTKLSGVDYTNKALFEIHKLLNRGINVFQVGSKKLQKDPFKYRKKLKAPSIGYNGGDDSEDESISKSNPNEIFGMDEKYAELKEKAKDKVLDVGKDMLSSLNDSMGNIGGYLRHKLFGDEYEYKNDQGQTVHVKKNDKGGLFGFLGAKGSEGLSMIKSKVGGWMKDVAGYFDYGNDGTESSKKKQIMTSAVGALAGGGLLGGPLGMIMGGIAGSALSASDVGNKIHDMFFGRDKETGKAKGLLTKIGDKIIDPIKYQFEKTMHHVGEKLKTNIIGPLSDIGYAIKERILSTTSGALGKALKFITAPIRLAGKLLGKLILGGTGTAAGIAGGVTRGAISAGTGMVGAGLNGIADLIAFGTRREDYARDPEGNILIDPKTGEPMMTTVKGRQGLKDRRKARKSASTKFESYKDWQQKSHARRSAAKDALDEALKEEIADNVQDLTYHATHTDGKNSIFTHDDNLIKKMDTLLEYVTGKKHKSSDGNIATDEDKAAMLGAAATIVTEGNVSNDDQNQMNKLIEENSKPRTPKQVLSGIFKKLLKNQEKDKVEAEEKKTSLWDILKSGISTIASGVIKYLPMIAGIGAAIGFVSEWIQNFDLPSTLDHLKSNLITSLKKLFPWTNDDDSSDSDSGANAATALLDAQTNSIYDWANPMANIYHNDRDAAGNMIKDQGKTRAKSNWQFKAPFLQSIVSNGLNQAKQFKQARTAASVAEQEEILRNIGHTNYGSKMAKGVARNIAQVGIMDLGGRAVGGIATKIASHYGLDEQTSAKVGSMANAVTTAGLMVNKGVATVRGKASIVDSMLDLIKKAFNFLAKKLKMDKHLAKAGKAIDNLFDNLYDSTVGKMTVGLADTIAERIAKATGKASAKEVAAALTAGVTIAGAGLIGVISGVCGVEHLFGVMPGQANATMKTISGILRGLFEALEATPVVGILVAAFDILDEFVFKNICIDDNGLGHTLKSFLASFIYKCMTGEAGAADLSAKQAALADEKEYYNSKYGTDIDLTTFNDMVNNEGLLDRIWRGKMQYDQNGHIVYDNNGSVATGGLSRFIKGGDYYETDANGNVIVNADGSYNVTHTDNIVNRSMQAIKSWFTGIPTGIKNLPDMIKNLWGYIKSGDIEGFYKAKYGDEDGENANSMFGDVIFSLGKFFGTGPMLVSSITHSIASSIANVISGTDKNRATLDSANGELEKSALLGDINAIWSKKVDFDKSDILSPVWNIGLFFSKVFNTIGGIVVKIGDSVGNILDKLKGRVQEIIEGIEEFANDPIGTTAKAASKAATTIGNKVSNAWNTVTSWFGGPVEYAGTGMKSSSAASNSAPIDINASWEAFRNGSNTSSNSSSSSGAWSKIQNTMSHESISNKVLSYADTLPEEDSRTQIEAASDYKTGMPSDVFNKVYKEGYDFSGNPLGVRGIITSDYGMRNVYGHPEFHYGVDMIPASGSETPNVVSPVDGTVSFVKKDVSNATTGMNVAGTQQTGNMVTIVGKDGVRRKFMHLGWGSIPSSIKEGTEVHNGTVLGRVGSTGRSTGPHLHYQIEKSFTDSKGNEKWQTTDPMEYLIAAKGKSKNKKADLENMIDEYQNGIDYQSHDSDIENSKGESLLSRLMSTLSTIGQSFLYHISGGLIGSRPSDDDSSISDSYNANVSSVNEFLQMVAAEIGTKENPPKSNNVKYNTWFYGKEVSGDQYMWCMVFVQWCFDHAGLTLPYKSAGCAAVWDWYNTNHPEKCHTKNPKPGDIVILGRDGGGHTGIVEKVLGDSYHTIEGNCGDEVKRVTSRKLTDDNLRGFITAVDFTSLSSSSSVGNIQGASELWAYFKKLGYSDNAIAGILGCWKEESSMSPKRMEGDYTGYFKEYGGYDALVNDRTKMDEYTKKLFSNYASKGLSINQDGYKASDGHYYPGLGFAQWTGERAKKLLEFAKSKGKAWYDSATQLEFFDHEMGTRNSGLKDRLNATTSTDAATQMFEKDFEGSQYGLSTRQSNARSLISQYGKVGGPATPMRIGRSGTKSNIGGPTVGVSNYITNTRAARQSASPSYSKTTRTTYSTPNVPTPSTASRTYSYGGVTSSSIDISGVVTLLTRAVEELSKITNNTASSSDLLGSLNEKDFVDKGVRDSIEALGKAGRANKKKTRLPQTSATTALNMANP